MQPYIDAVKQNVISFAQDLASNNRDYRLGLVTFEDYVVSKEPDCDCAYRDKMTSNVHEFTQWVGFAALPAAAAISPRISLTRWPMRQPFRSAPRPRES